MDITRTPTGQVRLDDQPVLHKKIRDKNNKTIGVVVATAINDEVRFGFSVCNVKKGDVFKLDLGLKVALGRALNHEEITLPFKVFNVDNQEKEIPAIARPYLESLYWRSQNYFKYLWKN